MSYEVQHYTLFYGWVNTWSYAEADGVMQPETFAAAAEAEAALDEFFEDLAEEVAAGQMAPHDRNEFRVRPATGIGISGQLDAGGGCTVRGQPKCQRPKWKDVSVADDAIVMSNSQSYDLTEDRYLSTSRILEQAALAENCVLKGKQR